MLSLSEVEAAEQLLCDGMPKMKVGRLLELSRTTIDKITAGKHPLQDEAAFLERYSRRPALPSTVVRPNTHTLETIERVEVLLCYWWRDRFSRSMEGRRLTLEAIQAETGLSRRVIEHTLRGSHPAQLERDGRTLPYGLAQYCHERETVDYVRELLSEGVTKSAVSFKLGMTPRTVGRISRGDHYQQQTPLGQVLRTRHMRRVERAKGYLPSPRAIERRCAAIQKTWTFDERMIRAGAAGWSAPQYAA
jgi:hypothetical protein